MPRTRIALVAPPMDFMSELYGFRTRSGYRNQPPLGIACIAGVLRHHGFPVTILDAAAEGWDLPTTVDRVLAWRPDVIGVTAITLETPAAYALLRALRPQTRATLVLGGAHANACFETVPDECPEVDVVVAGDGEPTMLELCRALEAGKTFERIRGLRCRREDGSFTAFRERPPIHDLDTLPLPAYDLLPLARYVPLPHRRKRLPSTCMITSRGCSYAKCSYCEMSKLVRRNFRRHSPERVVREMKALVSMTGARDLYFQDDIFITDEAWVREFCDRLDEAALDVIWSCESRFVGVSEDLLRRMRRSGCWRIYYGFETGNQELLDRIQKGFTLDEAREGARCARAAGLEVVGFFMLGLPGETPELGRRTIDFSLSLGLSHAMYSLTVAHRGTELYRICSEEGTILLDRDYAQKRAAFLPRGYRDVKQLEDLQAEAFRRFYLRPAYWRQCLSDLRSLDDVRYYAEGVRSLFTFLD